MPLSYGKWHSVVEGDALIMRVKLKRAGHILGSNYVDVALNDTAHGNKQRVVFSGDLGAPHTPLLPVPKSPYQADVLVLESTYDNRNHECRQARGQALKAAIEQGLTNRGTVIIPAFSIGRTQELLYELETIVHAASPTSDWCSLEVIVDSPLAARSTPGAWR
ncbi:MBL fold metallo-hydrolase [Vreelandella arcis]|uniref:Metallo-beta-lactamase family protein n=1 Tax=Vreelandella arcis TaxID=416873 RepID=A0A1H0CHQ2_9GAMM|nr:MBL fold metallo-hydrolase [Halomonas arcis]SDN57390.1 metallo-beta-lactamase family protein [Halomonas arcis]